MSYADAVMWVWVVALLGTVVAFATAWRGLLRAEAAVRDLHRPSATGHELDAARAEVDAATEAAASARHALVSRTVVAPS